MPWKMQWAYQTGAVPLHIAGPLHTPLWQCLSYKAGNGNAAAVQHFHGLLETITYFAQSIGIGYHGNYQKSFRRFRWHACPACFLFYRR